MRTRAPAIERRPATAQRSHPPSVVTCELNMSLTRTPTPVGPPGGRPRGGCVSPCREQRASRLDGNTSTTTLGTHREPVSERSSRIRRHHALPQRGHEFGLGDARSGAGDQAALRRRRVAPAGDVPTRALSARRETLARSLARPLRRGRLRRRTSRPARASLIVVGNARRVYRFDESERAAAGSRWRCNSAGNAHPLSNTRRQVRVVLIAPVEAFMAAAGAPFRTFRRVP